MPEKIIDLDNHSPEFKQHHITHMMQVVQTRIYNRTGKNISIQTPTTKEELEKLEAMYYETLENL